MTNGSQLCHFTSIDEVVQEKEFLTDFLSIQYGCHTMWLVHDLWTPWYPQGLGTMWVKFPLDLTSRSRDDYFKSFFLQKIMAAKPCNLGDVIVGELFVPHGEAMIPVKFHLNLCNRFGEKFWSFFYVKNKNACRTTWAMNVINFFSTLQFSPRWPSKVFLLIG